MKKTLVKKILSEFDKDRDIIVKNLLEGMDIIVLETSNDYERIKLTIKYEKKGEAWYDMVKEGRNNGK